MSFEDEAQPCKEVVRPVQRAREQDEYMDYYDEANPQPPGTVTIEPSLAPMTVTGEKIEAVRALEEAPDGLRMMDWSGQSLDQLPKIPPEYANARVVLLHDNKLPSFPQELTQIRFMQKLRLDSNSITSVPQYINTFSQLKDLRASDNSVAMLSSNIGRCKMLTAMDLQRNQLSLLPPAIGACVALEKLWLTSNRLASLPFTMSHLGALKSLRVDKNKLTDFGFNVGRLTNLTQLRLGFNAITEVPDSIGDASGLTELGLESNSLEALPPSIGSLTVRLLRLDQNPIKRPPREVVVKGREAVFLFLRRLQHAEISWDLDLSHFGLKQVPFPNLVEAAGWEVNTWCRVKQLSLHNNKLVSLPVEIELMSNLTVLDLQSNALVTLPPSIAAISALQVLDAASNLVQALPAQMRNNVQLQELLLENNRLNSIPPVIADMAALRELRITNNRLTAIPEELAGATLLTHLSLQHNLIRRVPDQLTGLVALESVDLSHNALTDLPSALGKIRPLSDPPLYLDHRAQAAQRRALGGVLDPRVRRQRVRDALFGGRREGYRSQARVPLEEREGHRPEGAGERRGWALVRFALFGEEGPHLRPRPPPPRTAGDPLAAGHWQHGLQLEVTCSTGFNLNLT